MDKTGDFGKNMQCFCFNGVVDDVKGVENIDKETELDEKCADNEDNAVMKMQNMHSNQMIYTKLMELDQVMTTSMMKKD